MNPKEKKTIQFDMDLSISKENLPKKIFADEFKNYLEQVHNFTKKGNQFFSLITIYFDSQDLDDE